ncbi:hypothetical protein NQD34_016852 [Periophthalmus magnuspinnatus]|uniref:putative interleukin-17 receptor E-like isoform X2 n=1 Tax=Periophthalmus magnuspinnatus TaxID=409849 RepID=UPI0022BF75CD|nr:putative interleukin-17 receptor E-like isoform X2 [Periophthalmus magnuspinnatus]KAJ0012518.1 hypothetical protein NQD34_016852 [Periophthalmus magnuspinnatus]
MEEVVTCFLKSLPVVSLIICCISLTGTAEDQNKLERIEMCSTKCSQGLNCETSHSLFSSVCQTPSDDFKTSPVFQDINLSTVLRCEERQKCSLHLSIQMRMRIRDSIHGVSICTLRHGLIPNCKVISFSKDSIESGSLVDIENDCTKISLSQKVLLTVETVPRYCNTNWTQVYTAPGCSNRDLQQHVPDCITGKLLYKVNPEEKSITVDVIDFHEGHNYNLRLCHAKGFICTSTGPLAVIKKEDTIKRATLSYSRLVPCLCIEGWSAVLDARRVQVCPFKQYVEELWTGITFDPIESSLSWQPLCPVTARVTLCQKQEHGDCINLPNTSHNVTRQKVKFAGVESHPQLCMKFSVNSEDWIRCPFGDQRFTAWEVSRHPEGAVLLYSPARGIFSVELCEVESMMPPKTCQSAHNYTIKVENRTSVEVPLPSELLHRTFCLQVRRQDVRYSVTLVHCFDPILQIYSNTSVNPSWIIVPTGALLALVILIALMLHVCLTVHQRRTQKEKNGSCPYEKQKDYTCVFMVSALPSKSALLGEAFVPVSPQNRSNEKAILLSD